MLAFAAAQPEVFRTGGFSTVLISAAVEIGTGPGKDDDKGKLTKRGFGSTCTPEAARLSSRPNNARCSRSRWSIVILAALLFGKFRRPVQVAQGPGLQIFQPTGRRISWRGDQSQFVGDLLVRRGVN